MPPAKVKLRSRSPVRYGSVAEDAGQAPAKVGPNTADRPSSADKTSIAVTASAPKSVSGSMPAIHGPVTLGAPARKFGRPTPPPALIWRHVRNTGGDRGASAFLRRNLGRANAHMLGIVI